MQPNASFAKRELHLGWLPEVGQDYSAGAPTWQARCAQRRSLEAGPVQEQIPGVGRPSPVFIGDCRRDSAHGGPKKACCRLTGSQRASEPAAGLLAALCVAQSVWREIVARAGRSQARASRSSPQEIPRSINDSRSSRPVPRRYGFWRSGRSCRSRTRRRPADSRCGNRRPSGCQDSQYARR